MLGQRRVDGKSNEITAVPELLDQLALQNSIVTPDAIDSRVRDRTAARNLALLRKIALNLVGRDRTTKASVRARRKKAAWNDGYMLELLVG